MAAATESRWVIVCVCPTLTAESFSIDRYCDGLGIDRLSSHPCENRIGNIRTECKGNHSTENVLYSTTRYEYLKYALKDLNIKEDRPIRLNLGGCKTSVGEIDFDFTIDDKTFADLIMKIGYYQNATKEEMDFVFEKLNQFTIEAPYDHAFNISVNSNVAILNRIYNSHDIKNDYFPYYKQRFWSSSENKLISDMLLAGNEYLIYI